MISLHYFIDYIDLKESQRVEKTKPATFGLYA